jgi:hypothetical protein
MSYVVITKKEFEEKLRADKGWNETFSGNEFVYDFHLARPIVIKVASSISRDTNRGRNKGADAIRIFAVEKDTTNREEYKVVRGLIKAKRVYRTTNWRKNLEKTVNTVIKQANFVYDKYRK